MRWWKRLFNPNPEWAAQPAAAPATVDINVSAQSEPRTEMNDRMLERTRQALSDTNIAAGLTACGYATASPASIKFVRDALWDKPLPKGIDLRRFGIALEGPELKERGITGNALVTMQYYDILTEAGRAEAVHSAQAIVSAIMNRGAHDRRVRQAIDVFGEGGMVEIIPNNMLAGPCPGCLSLAEKPIPLKEAPSGPLPSCPHPDQCAIRWRSILVFS